MERERERGERESHSNVLCLKRNLSRFPSLKRKHVDLSGNKFYETYFNGMYKCNSNLLQYNANNFHSS